MLEDWLGVTLIDRTRKPLQFTPVAKDNQLAFRSLVARIYEFRAVLKSESLDSAGLTIAAQHTLAASYVPAVLEQLRQLDPEQSFRIRSANRADSVAMLMRGEAEILITHDTPQSPCNVPEQLARRHVLGQDDLMLVANPALHKLLNRVSEGARVPMLCFPPDSFFGQVVRAEALPELMRRQQVVVRCVSEFAMGLRELALVGQGAAWLPASLIQHDLARKSLLPLGRLGHSVRMDIVVYFAVLEGDKGDSLQRSFELLCAGPAAARSAGGGHAARPRRIKRPLARTARTRARGRKPWRACGRRPEHAAAHPNPVAARARQALGAALVGVIALAAIFIATSCGGPPLLYTLLFGVSFNYLSHDARIRPGIEFNWAGKPR